jgi:peptidylprolyl isomerase
MRRLLVFVGAVALIGCLHPLDSTEPTPSDPSKETFASSLGVNIAEMSKTSLGTYYKDIMLGTGVTLSTRAKVIVDYAGYLKSGTKFGADTAVRIPLDSSIVGFSDGMIGMKVGGERLVVIPSLLAYGNTSVGPIPANSTLIFDIKLRSITQ